MGERPGAIEGPDKENQADWSILSLLLASEEHAGLWSVDELALEIASSVEAADAIARLHRAGLVHRCGEFVFPTRAASRYDAIVE
jgi:hypothetical protein